MFNVHIDVRGPFPVLFHGMRAFKLEGLTRGVTVEQAVELLHESKQIDDNDPLVQMLNYARYERNN